MTYQPLHRRPRWHDRLRNWLRGFLDTIWPLAAGWEEQPLTDDHGNHIGGDLPGYQYDDEPQVIRTTEVGGVHLPLSGHDDPLPVNLRVNCAFAREVMPVGQSDHPPARMQVRGVPRGTLVNVPRPVPGPLGQHTSGHGPGYRQNVLRPGRVERRIPGEPWSVREPAGPGYLTMFDIRHVRSPWPPRTWPAIVSGPRIRPELRLALLAGTT